MKITRFAWALALCGSFAATSAYAQTISDTEPSVSQVEYDADEDTPIHLVNTSLLGDGSLQKDGSHQKNGNYCDSGKGGKGGKGGCGRWSLFGGLGGGWEASGHIAGGFTANADHPTSKYNGPMTFNDRDREGQINQLYMSIGREADNGGCGWAWGGRVDLLYGTDYIFTQAAGLETNPDGTNNWNGHRHYGLAMPQAYVDVKYNNLNVRMGHFYTIMGYEVVDATGNFFYSHAYTMQYAEPFTHTGALASWEYSDNVTLIGGIVNGWDAFDQVTDNVSFLGGFSFTPDSELYTLTTTFITGEQDGFNPPTSVRSGYSMVLDMQLTERLNYVVQHDNFWQEDVGGPGIDAEWYGINQYFLYTVNDCWKLGARVEWFRDDDGARLGGTTPLRETAFGLPANPTLASAAMAAGNYYNITLGANWTPRERLTVRPEVRWDWSDGTMGQPFDSKDSMFTAGFDAILTF